MELLAFFHQFYQLPEADFQLLQDNLHPKTFEKGEFITSPGQIQTELYFVRKGIQMSFFDSEKKTHVIAFTYAPGLCAIPESFALQRPSTYNLICLSDSEMDAISYSVLQELFNRSQHLERLFRIMTEHVLGGIITRHIELHSQSMEERFLGFCRRSPHLLTQLPHKYIASYLNIDPTNFSKLYNKVKI